MNIFESSHIPEKPKIEKQQVIDSYKKFLGVGSPDDLTLDDPDAIKAQELYDTYFEQQREAVKGDTEREQRVNFEQTMFYLDAGFTDPSYAEDVLLDFAEQDIENAEEEFPKLAEEMKARVQKYKAMLLTRKE